MSRIAKIIVTNFAMAYVLSTIISVILLVSNLKYLMGLIIAGNFFITVALTLSSLTIFFNIRKTVSASTILSFLSFFLFPIAVSISLYFEADSSVDRKLYLVNLIVFNLVLLLSFLRFRKNGCQS